MANAYGTVGYDGYFEKYRKFADGYGFTKTDRSDEHFEIGGIKFDVVIHTSDLYKNESDGYP